MRLLKEGLRAGHWYHSSGPNKQVEEFLAAVGVVMTLTIGSEHSVATVKPRAGGVVQFPMTRWTVVL